MVRLLPVVLALAAAPAAGFEFPLTRTQRAQKLVEQGHWQILRGDYHRAIESCSLALSVRDDWAPAYLCRSEARMWIKDPQADSDARLAAKLDPRSGEPYRLLGIMDFETGRYPVAIENFDKALTRSKLRTDVLSDIYYYRAKSKLSLGDAQNALKDVQRGLGILQGLSGDYGDWSFYSLRAEIYRRLGQEQKADKDERQVLDLVNQRMKRRPYEAADLLRRRAESHSLLRLYDEAANDYGELLSKTTDAAAVLVDRAHLYALAGKHEAAMRDLDRAVTKDPENTAARRQRAVARFGAEDYPGAIVDLDAYLKTRPQDASAFAYRGIAKRFVEDFRGALEDLLAAQAMKPDDGPPLWGHLAFAREMLGQHKEALQDSAKALAQDPEDFSAHAARAQAGWALERCAEVAASLDWLVQRSTDSAHFRSLRGECRCARKEFQGCLSDLETAVSQSPRSKYLSLSLAQNHRLYLSHLGDKAAVGDLRRSLDYYSRSAGLGSLSPEDRLGRAWSLFELSERLKDPGERLRLLRQADADCRAALKNKPRHDTALKLRRLVRQRLTTVQRPKRR